MSVVLDASVFIAVISPNELNHSLARRFWDAQPEDEPFIVPTLFRTEVIAALARRGESDDFLNTVDAIVTGPRFHAVSLDARLLEYATLIARQARLRAYDAVYVALADSSENRLCTLDLEILRRTQEVLPHITVILP